MSDEEADVQEYAGYILKSNVAHFYVFPEDIRHEMLGSRFGDPVSFYWIYGVKFPKGGGKITGMIERNAVVHLYSDPEKLRADLDAWGRDWSRCVWLGGIEFHK